MDMLNILKNMDAAAKGEKPAAGAENVNDMKTILESIQSVEECGMEGSMPMAPEAPEDKVSMNVTLNARGDAVEDLIKLMGGQSNSHSEPDGDEMPMKLPMPAPSSSEPDMAQLIAMTNAKDESVEEEEWDNSPDEEYSDTKTMTKDLSGGINREKKAYAAAQDGDNAMAVESSIKEQLWKALQEKLTTEGRGRGKSKKAKEEIDMKTTEGRGRGKKGRGRGRG
jgi:hypothetical protein